MKIEGKNIILEYDNDYEFIKLVSHIIRVEYGELRLKVKHSKPYQVIETQKSILLSRDLNEEEDGTDKTVGNYKA